MIKSLVQFLDKILNPEKYKKIDKNVEEKYSSTNFDQR